MPFGDRTGPFGLGPRSGRAMGYCAGFQVAGPVNPVPGRSWPGFGRGLGRGWFGGGRGCGNGFRSTGLPGWARAGYGYPSSGPEFTAKDEIDVLQDRADLLKKQLENIQNRISTLEKARAQESG